MKMVLSSIYIGIAWSVMVAFARQPLPLTEHLVNTLIVIGFWISFGIGFAIITYIYEKIITAALNMLK